MKHVITQKTNVIWNHSKTFSVHQIPSAKDNVIWMLVWEEEQCKNGIVIDGPHAKDVLAFCEKEQVRLRAILNTHTHGDHIGINHDLDRRGLLQHLIVCGYKGVQNQIPGITHPVQDKDFVEIGPLKIQILLTEGHINGHISFLIDGFLFCGDTLFGAGCGYLFDGPPSKMYASLQKIAALPEETYVCCAHEYTEDNLKFAWTQEPENPDLQQRIINVCQLRKEGYSSLPSTIGMEKQTNPFIRSDSVDVFRYKRKEKDGGLYRNIPWPPSFKL